MSMHCLVVQVPCVCNCRHGNTTGQQLKDDDRKAEDIHFLIVGLALQNLNGNKQMSAQYCIYSRMHNRIYSCVIADTHACMFV